MSNLILQETEQYTLPKGFQVDPGINKAGYSADRRIDKVLKSQRTVEGQPRRISVNREALSDLVAAAEVNAGEPLPKGTARSRKKAFKEEMKVAKVERWKAKQKPKLEKMRKEAASGAVPRLKKLWKKKRWLGVAGAAIPIGLLATQHWAKHQQERAKQRFGMQKMQMIYAKKVLPHLAQQVIPTTPPKGQVAWTQPKQPLPQYRPIAERTMHQGQPDPGIYHPRIKGRPNPYKVATEAEHKARMSKHASQKQKFPRTKRAWSWTRKKTGARTSSLWKGAKGGAIGMMSALAFKEALDQISRALKKAEVVTPDIRIDVEPMVGYSLEATERYFKIPIKINLFSPEQLGKLKETLNRGVKRLKKGALRNAFAFYIGLITAELLSRGFTRTKHDVQVSKPISIEKYGVRVWHPKLRRKPKFPNLKQATYKEAERIKTKGSLKKRLKKGAGLLAIGAAGGAVAHKKVQEHYAGRSKLTRNLIRRSARGDMEARRIVQKAMPTHQARERTARREIHRKGFKKARTKRHLKQMAAVGVVGGGSLATVRLIKRRRKRQEEKQINASSIEPMQLYFNPRMAKSVWSGAKWGGRKIRKAWPHIKTGASKTAGAAEKGMHLAFMGLIGKEVAGEVKHGLQQRKQRKQWESDQNRLGVQS